MHLSLNKEVKMTESSNVRILHPNVGFFRSDVRSLHSYTYTENTTKTTNKEHTPRAKAKTQIEKIRMGSQNNKKIIPTI